MNQATISQVTASQATIRPIAEFDGIRDIWPRGERHRAMRAAVAAYRERFKSQGVVKAVKSFNIAAAPYPAEYALQGYSLHINPVVNIINRMLVIRYEDFDGRDRILVWEPTVAEGSKKSPFYGKIAEMGEKFGLERFFVKYYNEPNDILPSLGLSNDDVDYVSFDHLHVQDPRMIMGTTDGEFAPIFPNGKLIVQQAELGTFEGMHPMQQVWYVDGGLDKVSPESLITVDGDVELGKGVALLYTPGHTDGNHSLCLNTPDGIWVSSENGTAADCWQPELSKIPGVKAHASFYGREVVLNSNTLEDSLDQYDSMVKEKLMADFCKKDPRWKQILPSSECAPWLRQWPLIPSMQHGGIEYGSF